MPLSVCACGGTDSRGRGGTPKRIRQIKGKMRVGMASRNAQCGALRGRDSDLVRAYSIGAYVRSLDAPARLEAAFTLLAIYTWWVLLSQIFG